MELNGIAIIGIGIELPYRFDTGVGIGMELPLSELELNCKNVIVPRSGWRMGHIAVVCIHYLFAIT